MKVTPLDINHRTFSRRMFGIDENEVADFLQSIAGQLESLIYERNVLRENLREKDVQIAELKERDNILKNTITAASQMSEKIKADSEREAKLIIADAQQKAEFLTRDSRDSLRKVYQEIADMKRARLQFEANLKALAQAHLTLLEQSERFLPNIGLPQQNFVESQLGGNQGLQASNNSMGISANGPAAQSHRNVEISPLSAIR